MVDFVTDGSSFTDMQMLVALNSKERTAEEFETLFEEADPRLKLVNVHRSAGSPLSIMEVRLGAVAQ